MNSPTVPARIKTFTGDLLAVSVDPPAIYGMVQFEGGGRFMADFTDCELADCKVGLPVKMVFRRRFTDDERGFSGYFWKAVPQPGAAARPFRRSASTAAWRSSPAQARASAGPTPWSSRSGARRSS